jgi:DNA-binding transcriptional LysR family regulator
MNSIFTEENLLAFTTAARFGSFSKAAAELGVTTSAISYTIKRMETGLDVVLFVRNTRSIELTESGFYFYRKATDLLNDFHAIKRGIDTISQGIEARVRICINQLLYTPRHTARLLQVLKKQFPPARSPSPPRSITASGIRSSITRPISRLARRTRCSTAAGLITPRSAPSAGCLPLRRNIRWRSFRNR